MIHTREMREDVFLFMTTKNGTVKRLPAAALKNIRNVGIRALNLDEGDELISVRATDGAQNILIATRDGMAICFSENDVRPMGRDAMGVRGIRLREGDECVGAVVTQAGMSLLSVTENGYGKRTPVEEYMRGDDNQPQHRGGKGLKGYQVTEKTGKVAAAMQVSGEEDLLLIADDGTMIRTAVDTISTYGRAAQGVRVMRLNEGCRLISMALTEREEAEETEEAASAQNAETSPAPEAGE